MLLMLDPALSTERCVAGHAVDISRTGEVGVAHHYTLQGNWDMEPECPRGGVDLFEMNNGG